MNKFATKKDRNYTLFGTLPHIIEMFLGFSSDIKI